MQGRTDALSNKPKFPREQTTTGSVVTLSLGNTATFPTSTLKIASVTVGNVANGWVANAVNIGNTFGVQGFNLIGPYVVNVSTNTITLSQAVGNNLPVGTVITFSQPKGATHNIAGNVYNANTYLISTKRMTNGNSILQTTSLTNKVNTNTSSPIAHTGWVHAKPQTGYVTALTIKTTSLNVATNGFITFTANASYPGGANANASYSVNANGYINGTILVNKGAGYTVTPNANANGVYFTVTMGGRANRVLTEVLSVVANTSVLDTTSGGLWFPGV